MSIVACLASCARPQYVADQHAALQAPVTLGEGNTGKPPLPPPDLEPAKPTTTQAAPASFDPSSQPDPPPAETSVYYKLTLRYCEANVHLIGVNKVVLDRPTTLPSKMGRFAVELWIGHELLERARFDFPLLGAETNEQGLGAAAQFGPKADVVWTVAVAERPRTNQAWVVDRLVGKRWDLDWPPGDDTKPAAVSKAAEQPCPVLSSTAP